MAIISRSESPVFRRYGNTQFRYALTYVIITLVVLLFLNLYCSQTSQRLFYRSHQVSMIEKNLLAASEIADLEVLNTATVSSVISGMDSLTAARITVTDKSGIVIYDSFGDAAVGKYALFPEIVEALAGNDVFYWNYHDGTMQSCAATPIYSYGSLTGCVYMAEYDDEQGALIQSLQVNLLSITLVLELVLILFSLAFSTTFSRRLNKIMASMRIIQEGDYTHKVSMGGHDELTFLGEEFNDLTERLNTSEQKRRQFVSDASHELKTPLASIKLLSDSILHSDCMDPEMVREFVGDIGNEADRLTRMTQKLLTLTKSDIADNSACEIICMAPTVNRVAKLLAFIAEQNHITLQLELEDDSPILIFEDDLYQIVFNLVENGIKYNTPGGKLTVKLLKEDDNAVLSVSDTGVGIPEDALSHVFERFYRVDKARSRQTGGSGLGLAIVRNIVERNRGEIRVESTVGKGTTFTVSFPAFDTEVDSE